MTEIAEVTFTLKATVPAKYKPLIEAFVSLNPDMFQGVANEWIHETRLQAAKAGCEVDDVIAAAVNDAKESA